MTVAFFVAATFVTLLQFIRLRDRRLLPLMAAFALAGLGHASDDPRWAPLFHMSSAAAGLALVVMLAPRHTPPRR